MDLQEYLRGAAPPALLLPDERLHAALRRFSNAGGAVHFYAFAPDGLSPESDESHEIIAP